MSEEINISGHEEIEWLELAEQSWPQLGAQSSYRDILDLALTKERVAARYYQLIAGRSALRAVQDLFLLLAAEERRHVRWVEKMLAEI